LDLQNLKKSEVLEIVLPETLAETNFFEREREREKKKDVILVKHSKRTLLLISNLDVGSFAEASVQQALHLWR